MIWTLVITGLSILLAIYLTRTAVLRQNRAHRWLRIVMSLLAVLALALMAIGIEYKTEVENESGTDGVIILTDGADMDSLAAFREKHPAYKLITTDPGIASRLNTDPVSSLTDSSNGSAIHIFGNGLEAYQLKRLGNSSIYFHAARTGSVFGSVSWPSKLKTGEALTIQGTFNQTSPGTVKLVLQGFSTTLDSLIFNKPGNHSFELSAIPKQSGRAVFELVVMNGDEIVKSEKIPFEVRPSQPARVLILAAAPDFENRFLKNWLSQREYALAIRTVTSRNKMNQELINLENVGTGPVNSNLLNNFDLVIGDATAIAALSASERNALRVSVEQQGTGLLIKADSITSTAFFYNNLVRLKQSPVNNMQQVKLHSGDTSGLSFPTISLQRPLYIDPARGLRPLLTDAEKHIYATVGLAGSGKIITSTLANTYSWVLAGDTLAYRKLWSMLISEAAKSQRPDEVYTTVPAIPYVGNVMKIIAAKPDSLPSKMNINYSLIPVQQNLLLPFQWEAFYWPRKSGWQQVTSSPGANHYWYVFSKGEWKDAEIAERKKLNEFVASQINKTVGNTGDGSAYVTRQVSPVYFFVIFILCCGYLWIEEKYYNSKA